MNSTPLLVTLQNSDGGRKSAAIDLKHWERKDALRKAMQWGGAIALLGLVMVPIPLVHFFSPIIVLLAAPLGGILIFRLYNGGSDMHGKGECPSCAQVFELTGSADRWPVQKICPACRRSISIVQAEIP